MFFNNSLQKNFKITFVNFFPPRFLDDWRGHRCGPDMDWKNPEKKTNTDGLWSGANTQYHLEGENVKKMHMSGSLVRFFFIFNCVL